MSLDAADLELLPFTQITRITPCSEIDALVDNIVQTVPQAVDGMIIIACMIRSIGDGRGERDIFYNLIHSFCRYRQLSEIVCEIIHSVPRFGCWKDMLVLWDENPELRSTIDSVILQQFLEDQESDEPSLLAKWLPREGSKFGGHVRRLSILLFPLTPEKERLRKYRQVVSYLSKKIDVTEIKMCNKQWSLINPDSVPKQLMNKCKNAFLNRKESLLNDRILCENIFRNYLFGLKGSI